jgi:multidrug efflux pump subunit AcrB
MLTAVPGVAGVSVRGGTDLGVSVSYDPVLLRRLGMSPQLLSNALNGARIVRALGVQHEGTTVRNVVLRDQPDALSDLEARCAGSAVACSGWASWPRCAEKPRGRFFRIDGEPAVATRSRDIPAPTRSRPLGAA